MLESLFNKVSGLEACIFIKKRLQHRCFHVSIAKSLRTSANDCFCISEMQITNNVINRLAENFIFNFKIFKTFCFLLSFANFSTTEFVCLFSNFFLKLFPKFLTAFLMFHSPVVLID